MINTNNEVCYDYSSSVNLENQITDLCELPLTLTVADVSKVLGVSKQNAYSLLHRKNFQSVQIGKRLIVPRPAFIKWMENPLTFESEVN